MYVGVEICEDRIQVAILGAEKRNASLHMPSAQTGKLYIGWDHTQTDSGETVETKYFPKTGSEEALKTYLTGELKKRGETEIQQVLLTGGTSVADGMMTRAMFRRLDIVRGVDFTDRNLAAALLCVLRHQKERKTDDKGQVLVIDGRADGLEATLFQTGKAGDVTLLEPLFHEKRKLADLEQAWICQTTEEAGFKEERDSVDWKQLCRLWNGRLQSERTRLREIFDEYGTDHLEDLGQVVGTLHRKKNAYPVTCAHLVRAYQKTIQKELDGWLDQVIGQLEQKKCPWHSRRGGDFRICLCGWLRDNELALRQVEEKFSFSTMDSRRVRLKNETGAIAVGAAVLASGTVKVGCPSPASVSIPGKGRQDLILRQGELVEFGKAYYPVSPEDGEAFRYVVTVNEMPRILLRRKGRADEVITAPAGDTERKTWGTGGGIVRIGVSLRPTGEYTLHYSY